MFTTGANGKTILLVAISKHATVTPAVKEKSNMSDRTVTVYDTAYMGYGCFRRELVVTLENFVAEDEHTITVKEKYFYQDSCGYITDTTYPKDIDTFIANENEWFSKHLAEIRERHEHTIRMANELRQK